MQSLTRWLHAHDPTRMVAVDVWGDHPPAHPGALYRGVDAIAETDYSGWYDNPHNSPAAVSAEISRRLSAMQRTFAGRVLVISEFGAESNGLNPGGSPGSYSFQSSLLARHIRAYAADPQLSGMFVYLLRDYPLVPTFEGGSIHGVLPAPAPDRRAQPEGAVHLRRAPQAGGRLGRAVVPGAGIGVESPVLQMRRGADQHGVEGHPA